MLYMVIETFKTPGALEVYRRAKEFGRMLPEGLEYVSSWIDLEFMRCFQLMRTDDPALFDDWTGHWSDLVNFEIVPVQTSSEAMESMKPRL